MTIKAYYMYIKQARQGRRRYKMLKDIESSAAALYDGGWRSADRDQLIAEYDLTANEADVLCKELERIQEFIA